MLLLVAALMALALLAGCGPGAPAVAAAVVQAPPTADPASARLWQDAAIFDLIRSAAAQSRTRVWVEMYEFDRDDLAAMLIAERDRGLDVRLVVDPSVAVSKAMASRMRAAGLSVRLYPVDERAHQIDHVKLFLTDQAAVVGGMNWGRHSASNHDYALESRSPFVLARLASIFDQDWRLAGGSPAPLGAAPGPIAQTAPGQEIRRLIGSDLAAARQVVLVEIYDLTDGDLLVALSAARARGARVRVLMDPGQAVNRRAYSLLRAAGVDARWYPAPRGTLLHAKVGLFDGRLVVGSANWSLSGLGVNHELDMETVDGGAVAAYRARFDGDWALAAGG